MARLAAALIWLATASQTALADDSPSIPDDVAVAAERAQVSPIDLLGAAITTGLDPVEYLYRTGELQRPAATSGYSAHVRLTYYNLTGRTYSGVPLYVGSTACSWNWPIGTRFRFLDGETVTCIDRGLLGNAGWLDVWSQPSLVSKYGAYTNVSVIP